MFTQIDEMISIRRPAVRRLWETAREKRRELALCIVAAPAAACVVFALVAAIRDGGDIRGATCDKPLCVEVVSPTTDEVELMSAVHIRLEGNVDRGRPTHRDPSPRGSEDVPRPSQARELRINRGHNEHNPFALTNIE